VGKFFYCDQCGKLVIALYDLILEDGRHIEVCRECFYSMPIDRLEVEN